MARKTVHTPTPDQTGAKTISFRGATLAEFGRADNTSGWFKFRVKLDDESVKGLFRRMGWPEPGTKESLQKLDGKLTGGYFIFTALDQIGEPREVNIEYESITDFQCLRLELEGRKKKGFRRELRFSGKFTCIDACANFEDYQIRSGNAKGQLKITYYDEPEQTEIPNDDDRQGSLIAKEQAEATPEGKDAVQ